MRSIRLICGVVLCLQFAFATPEAIAQQQNEPSHTQHPDAQWFPEAGLGLFIHWGIASVKGIELSWPMIHGIPLANNRVDDPAERERIIREGDWNLTGGPPQITPNQYWALAKDFNPQCYDPDKWFRAAKEAGFQYAVMTARHHDGFALWPSAYGDFNTKNHMGGRDLVKDYVDVCRRNGLKVGLYYSAPDWHFEREYMSYLYFGVHGVTLPNPGFPNLDADLKPCTIKHTEEELKQHYAAYTAMVVGQIEELLTRYGKIDLIWFDGSPNVPDGTNVISLERIRQLQPGIVINPRLTGDGDFITYEMALATDKVATGWAEFCTSWNGSWGYTDTPFRANGLVLGEFVTSRSLGINYLLNVGPTSTGELVPGVYDNMAVVSDWMKRNGASVRGAKPLPTGESASAPATSAGSKRYLFAIPKFKAGSLYDADLLPPTDEMLTLNGVAAPVGVRLLGDGGPLKYDHSENALRVQLPAGRRTKLVDVVEVDLGSAQ